MTPERLQEIESELDTIRNELEDEGYSKTPQDLARLHRELFAEINRLKEYEWMYEELAR